MNWKILVVSLAALSIATTAADAATKKKKTKPVVQQTTSQPAPPPQTMYAPPRPDECYTDEGYGRRLPCSYGGK